MQEYKLFIPGPIAVSEAIYAAMATPLVGHRSPDFVALYQEIQPRLQTLFGTQDPVYLSTSSAWGVMEGAVRNLTAKGVLNCMCGAFSDKWHDVSQRCGMEAGALRSEWGHPIDPDALRRELGTGRYDVVTLVHNETSCGLLNPLDQIMAVLREFPDVLTVVDTVSSFSAMPIPKDDLGIDVMLTGSQKALALPPGLSLISVSERARQRAATIPNRGYYFDLLEFQKNHENGMTPSTPAIPLIYGLRAKLEEIFTEGLEARYQRHARLNQLVRAWASRHDLSLFPVEEQFASLTLCCIRNDHNWDLSAINRMLKERFHCVIDGGYGKIKGKTFRISNMGDETDETIHGLLDNLDTVVSALSA